MKAREKAGRLIERRRGSRLDEVGALEVDQIDEEHFALRLLSSSVKVTSTLLEGSWHTTGRHAWVE